MKKVWDFIARDLWIILLDIVAVNAAYFLALVIRFYMNSEFKSVARDVYLPTFLRFAPFYTVAAILVFALFRLYGGMWRYAGINDMNRIIGANLVTVVIQVIGTIFIFPPEKANYDRMSFTYYMIGAVLQFLFICLIRFGYRILLVEKKRLSGRSTQAIPAMIIGAGETARKAIVHLEDTPYRPVVAANENSFGTSLNGVPIVADYKQSLSKVKIVFIADRKLDANKRKEIQEACEAEGVEVQDYTGALSNLGGKVPLASLMGLMTGPVKIVVDGKEQEYENGEEVLKALKEQYEVDRIEGAKVSLRKPNAGAYEGYDAWAKEHKETTGEDVSFF